MTVDDDRAATTSVRGWPGTGAAVPEPAGGTARAVATALALVGARARESGVFLVTGALYIVTGGVVAAVTGPLDLSLGSWAAAYLVLVGGVVQIALGGVQVGVSTRTVPRRVLLGEYVAFNAGSIVVIAGSLLGAPIVVDVGGVILAVALALFLYAARGARSGWPVRVYGAILVVVLVSIPVGLVLSHLRH